MGGTGSNAILGVTPYAGIELSPGFVLRPALAGGVALAPLGAQANEKASWFAARLDGCWRTPGTYPFNRGLQADFCTGVDAGLTVFPAAAGSVEPGAPASTKELPEIAVGPSVDLQGELGSDLSVGIRGVAGLNVVRGSFVDTSAATVKVPWLSGRVEVALSWRAR